MCNLCKMPYLYHPSHLSYLSYVYDVAYPQSHPIHDFGVSSCRAIHVGVFHMIGARGDMWFESYVAIYLPLGTDIFDSGPKPAPNRPKNSPHRPNTGQNRPQTSTKQVQNRPKSKIFDSGRTYPSQGRIYTHIKTSLSTRVCDFA